MSAKRVVVTGKLPKPRLQVEAYLRRAGYLPEPGLTYLTELLVAGDDALNKPTAKVVKAKQSGVKVIDSAQLDQLLMSAGITTTPLLVAPDIDDLPAEWQDLKQYLTSKDLQEAAIPGVSRMEKGAPAGPGSHATFLIKMALDLCQDVEQALNFHDRPAIGRWILTPMRPSFLTPWNVSPWDRYPLEITHQDRMLKLMRQQLVDAARDDLLNASAGQIASARAFWIEQGAADLVPEVEAFAAARSALSAERFQAAYRQWLGPRALDDDVAVLYTKILFDLAPLEQIDRGQGFLSYARR